MKSILAQDPETGMVSGASSPRQEQKQPGHPEYLSESEEEAIERLLEEDRQKLVAEDARRMQEIWKGRE